jgi:HK97 family phage major capsid protein
VESVPDTKTFDADYVKEIREESAHYRIKAKELEATSTILQKGYLPAEVTPSNSDVTVHINHFPLGDADNFHVSRAAYAKALSEGRMYGPAWDKYAKWEKEYLYALSRVERKGAQSDSISGQDGGFLAPERWNATWFGLLRSVTVLDQLPITRVSVPARVEYIPTVSTDITIQYLGENVAIAPTQFNFGQVSFTAHKSAALMNVSNELIRDAAGLADQLFRDQTARAIGTDRDTQLLVGSQGTRGVAPSGLGGPTPLLGHDLITNSFMYYPVTTAAGAITTTPGSFQPSYQHIGQMVNKIETLNGYTGATIGQVACDGVVAHSRFKQTVLSGTKMQDTQARPMWLSDLNAGSGTGDSVMGGGSPTVLGGFMGMKWALTGVLPTNLTLGGGTTESVMIFGSWKNYVLFECLTPTFDSTIFSGTASTGFAADQTQIRITYRYDGAPAYPYAFGILAGVLI